MRISRIEKNYNKIRPKSKKSKRVIYDLKVSSCKKLKVLDQIFYDPHISRIEKNPLKIGQNFSTYACPSIYGNLLWWVDFRFEPIFENDSSELEMLLTSKVV